MADNNQDENLSDSPESEGSETTQPQQNAGGATQNLKKETVKQVEKAATQKIATTLGSRAALLLANPALPGLLALFLVLLAFGAILAVGFGIIGYSGDNGRNPQEKAAVGNKQDSLDVKTIQCLDKASKIDAKGAGKLPPECIKPIQDWSQISIKMVNAMLSKVPKTPEGERATKLLNELLAAANEAHGVTAQTTLKQARELRKKLEDALAAANENAIIQKLIGISDNMKKVINYIKKYNPKQLGSFDCYETDNEILQGTFLGGATPRPTLKDGSKSTRAVINANFAKAQVGSELPGFDTSGAPTEEAIDATKKALRNGGIPIWLIRGSYSGEHWIIILNIDESNNIYYYDPAGGGTHNDPSTWAGTGEWKYFFGSPNKADRKNAPTRGYVFQP